MSNALRQTIRSLRPELFSPRYQKTFEAARHRHDALAGHHTVASVLAVLRDDRTNTYPERDALTRALVFEQQHAPSPFWSSALLTAYYPLLSRLRYTIFGDAILNADLDQVVITSFLSAVASIPLDEKPDRIALLLKQQTRKQFFRFVRDIHIHEEALCFKEFDELALPEDAAWPETCDDLPCGPRNPKDVAEAVTALLAFTGDEIDGECFDLMTARFICRKRISVYIKKMLPGLSEAERQALYQKIKRRHSRALERVRPKISEKFGPRIDPSLLCTSGETVEQKETSE